MEKSKGKRRSTMKISHLCIPRLTRGNTSCRSGSATSGTASTNRLSPAMSLLERVREAVFRLIMLTALSKATTHTGGSRHVPQSYYPNEPHHSEAVADCIEFIKKSASPEDARDRAATAVPLTVM